MVLNHGSIAKTLGGKGILRKKCIFLPQKWPKWPKMAKKIPWGWVSPQNGHFWDSLFSSLFFSDRSKWDFWGGRKCPKMQICELPTVGVGLGLVEVCSNVATSAVFPSESTAQCPGRILSLVLGSAGQQWPLLDSIQLWCSKFEFTWRPAAVAVLSPFKTYSIRNTGFSLMNTEICQHNWCNHCLAVDV